MNQTNDIISQLGGVLKQGLASINQYFLHARMLKHMGNMPLADQEYKQSLAAMKYADMLVERILELGGKPNLRELGKLMVGETPQEMLRCDFVIGQETKHLIADAQEICAAQQDEKSAALLQKISDSIGEHLAFIDAQTTINEAA